MEKTKKDPLTPTAPTAFKFPDGSKKLLQDITLHTLYSSLTEGYKEALRTYMVNHARVERASFYRHINGTSTPTYLVQQKYAEWYNMQFSMELTADDIFSPKKAA